MHEAKVMKDMSQVIDRPKEGGVSELVHSYKVASMQGHNLAVSCWCTRTGEVSRTFQSW